MKRYHLYVCSFITSHCVDYAAALILSVVLNYIQYIHVYRINMKCALNTDCKCLRKINQHWFALKTDRYWTRLLPNISEFEGLDFSVYWHRFCAVFIEGCIGLYKKNDL